MNKIDRSMYVCQLPKKNQMMILNALTKHINDNNIENPAEAIADGMNSRLYDLDEVLPYYMHFSDAHKYLKNYIYSCDDDTVIYAWNKMCSEEYDDNSVIHYMRDFSDFFEHGEAFDIVAGAIRGSFNPDLDYFKVFDDKRLNLDKICSYGDFDLWTELIDVDRLAKYMVENPDSIPGEMKDLHDPEILDWFGIEE